MAKCQLNFTAEEVEVLLGPVNKRNWVLFGSFDGEFSSLVKHKAWEEVRNVSGLGRSVERGYCDGIPTAVQAWQPCPL